MSLLYWPCLQKPLSYHGQPLILSESGSMWRYWQSLLLHSPACVWRNHSHFWYSVVLTHTHTHTHTTAWIYCTGLVSHTSFNLNASWTHQIFDKNNRWAFLSCHIREEIHNRLLSCTSAVANVCTLLYARPSRDEMDNSILLCTSLLRRIHKGVLCSLEENERMHHVSNDASN